MGNSPKINTMNNSRENNIIGDTVAGKHNNIMGNSRKVNSTADAPKISVVTICFNEPGLDHTLKSVREQTYRGFEWIVIDGGSNKETLDKFQRYRDIIDVFVSEKDAGIYDAMNKGIRRASGEYIIFMNAGDCFYDRHVLERVAEFMQTDNSDVIYGYIKVVGKRQNTRFIYIPAIDIQSDPDFFFEKNFPHQGEFIRRDLFDRCGMYRMDYKIWSDWVGNLTFHRSGARFSEIDCVIARYDDGGISSTRSLESQMENARVKIEFFPQYSGLLRPYCPHLLYLWNKVMSAFSVIVAVLKSLRRSGVVGDMKEGCCLRLEYQRLRLKYQRRYKFMKKLFRIKRRVGCREYRRFIDDAFALREGAR